jgi:hydrogenase nickel incorporation protein HypB
MKIEVVKNIQNANDAIALQNRAILERQGILAINVMSSPGSGKTSLILRTVNALRDKLRFAVIEGDIASSVDADRIGKEGIPVIQINTGGNCSLEAHMIGPALAKLPIKDTDILIIENVGNLICPAGFALGEHRKVVLASIPEGDDKPQKYPVIFAGADAVIINKTDLVDHFDFDIGKFRQVVQGLNTDVSFFETSCKTGRGIEAWCKWLQAERDSIKTGQAKPS